MVGLVTKQPRKPCEGLQELGEKDTDNCDCCHDSDDAPRSWIEAPEQSGANDCDQEYEEHPP